MRDEPSGRELGRALGWEAGGTGFDSQGARILHILTKNAEKVPFLVTDEPLPRPPAGPVFLVHRNPWERQYSQER